MLLNGTRARFCPSRYATLFPNDTLNLVTGAGSAFCGQWSGFPYSSRADLVRTATILAEPAFGSGQVDFGDPLEQEVKRLESRTDKNDRFRV